MEITLKKCQQKESQIPLIHIVSPFKLVNTLTRVTRRKRMHARSEVK